MAAVVTAVVTAVVAAVVTPFRGASSGDSAAAGMRWVACAFVSPSVVESICDEASICSTSLETITANFSRSWWFLLGLCEKGRSHLPPHHASSGMGGV